MAARICPPLSPPQSPPPPFSTEEGGGNALLLSLFWQEMEENILFPYISCFHIRGRRGGRAVGGCGGNADIYVGGRRREEEIGECGVCAIWWGKRGEGGGGRGLMNKQSYAVVYVDGMEKGIA